MSETVDNEIRDEVMANILAKPPNQVCFDCGSKAPKWSSPYLGIVICYECAAKHRSYGTHISFVRSVDLDKWNRKQLKSLELTGNSFTKERFNDLGVPLIGGNYDYNNSMVLKVRQEIAEKVRESLKPDDYKKVEDKKKEVDEFENININNEEIKDEEKEKKKEKNDKKKKKDKNEEKVEEKKEETEEKEEIKKPQKFEVDKKAKVENAKVIGKAGKINRIKKMDFNFDFDSFNDVNFSDFTKKDEDNDKEKKEDDEKKDEDEQKEKEHEKEKEKESENEGYQKSYGKKISKKELKNKFANKKAISSEDYAALEEGNSDNKIVKDRIKSMGNSQAISSEDVFGSNGESNVYEGESMTDKLKDMALNFTLSAAEKAKALKNKTNEFINKVQNKFSGGGY
jgi:hypothetical protein